MRNFTLNFPGERPFECDICQKRFTLKHSMMRHRKKHAESGSLSPSDDEGENGEEGSGQKSMPRPILPRLPMSSMGMSIPVMPALPNMSLGSSLNGIGTSLSGVSSSLSGADSVGVSKFEKNY